MENAAYRTRPRIRTNPRLKTMQAEVRHRSLVTVQRPRCPDRRLCLEAVTDDGRVIYLRFTPDGAFTSDTDSMHDLSELLAREADREAVKTAKPGDQLPVSPPATFKNNTIIAAIRLPEDPTLKPMRHVIVVEHEGCDGKRYSVHVIGWVQPARMWTAGSQGYYDLDRGEALRRMTDLAAPGE